MKIRIECSDFVKKWILDALDKSDNCPFPSCPEGLSGDDYCKKCMDKQIEWRTESTATLDNEEILPRAIDTFGPETQITVAIEEMSELQKELCKFFRNQGNLERISEEIADTEIMLEQLKILFDCSDRVAAWKGLKLLRLEDRIRAYQERGI